MQQKIRFVQEHNHAQRLVFQLAEVAVPRAVFQEVLERTARLCPAPG